jgi:4-amino-4-deoxy-L-arabinose transferase-like glycosyltransferase
VADRGGAARDVGRRDVLALGALLAVLVAWLAVPPPIGLHGEAREGLVVREIVRHGSWILPRRLGELPSKPPLFHWIAALGAHAFGFGDTSLRLPSALAAWVVAATTFVLGAALGGRRTGWLAAGALLGMNPFWKCAAEARVDMVLTACTTVSLAAFLLWYQAVSDGKGDGRAARAACWLAAAGAVLAKGPLGLVLPALVIVVFLASRRDLGLLRRLWSWPLAAAVLALDGGWYALAWRAGGNAVLARQLLQENVHRFVGAGEFAAHPTKHSPFRMETMLALQFLPWNLALVVAARDAVRGGREDGAGRFLHVWWLVMLVVFTVSAAKRPVYLLPLAPALALVAGRWLGRALDAGARRGLVAGAVVVAALGAAASCWIAWAYHARRESLAPFAAEVAARVPGGATLAVSRQLEPPDLYVLAYRLDRDLARVRAECGEDTYLLVPRRQVPELAPRGFVVVTSGEQSRVAVALVRAPSCGGG